MIHGQFHSLHTDTRTGTSVNARYQSHGPITGIFETIILSALYDAFYDIIMSQYGTPSAIG